MGRLAAVAALCGVLIALLLLGARPPHRALPDPVREQISSPPERNDALRRCRTMTAPDTACADAWEARRRHFFGSGKAQDQSR